MHLVVINCSPRGLTKSNTHIILEQFIKGYTENGNTVERHNLSQLGTWEEIRKAYAENDNILMAMPLFVECIPGLMMKFLESLPLKNTQTKLSFLLQGGFDEASQFRCCERYLKELPRHLGCEYGGTLIKGGMFVTHMMAEKTQLQMTQPFYTMGKAFAQDGRFTKEKADEFAGEEYLSKAMGLLFTILSPLQRLFFEWFFKKHGCTTKLMAKPYAKYLDRQ